MDLNSYISLLQPSEIEKALGLDSFILINCFVKLKIKPRENPWFISEQQLYIC